MALFEHVINKNADKILGEILCYIVLQLTTYIVMTILSRQVVMSPSFFTLYTHIKPKHATPRSNEELLKLFVRSHPTKSCMCQKEKKNAPNNHDPYELILKNKKEETNWQIAEREKYGDMYKFYTRERNTNKASVSFSISCAIEVSTFLFK